MPWASGAGGKRVGTGGDCKLPRPRRRPGVLTPTFMPEGYYLAGGLFRPSSDLMLDNADFYPNLHRCGFFMLAAMRLVISMRSHRYQRKAFVDSIHSPVRSRALV